MLVLLLRDYQHVEHQHLTCKKGRSCKKGRVKKGGMVKVLALRPIFQKWPLTIGRVKKGGMLKVLASRPIFQEGPLTIGQLCLPRDQELQRGLLFGRLQIPN